MNAPTLTDTERELLQLATAIETYRKDSNLSRSRLLAVHTDLGTDRTYGKIISGDFTELKIDRWLGAYRHVFETITSDEILADDSLLPDLTGPRSLCRAYLTARETRGWQHRMFTSFHREIESPLKEALIYGLRTKAHATTLIINAVTVIRGCPNFSV